VLTNVDADHLGTHGGDFEKLKTSFVEFLHNLPFYGLAVICTDDAVAASLLPQLARPYQTYGFHEEADVRAINIERCGTQSTFDVMRRGRGGLLAITLNLPGRHNVLNSLAAIAVASELEIGDDAIQRALASFQGIDRRLQHIADVDTPAGRVTIVDDYGHHPTEIAATLDALRQAFPARRIVLVFEPHRYTRTRDLLDDFATVLAGADVLLVSEVYAAGEPPIEGADGRAICRAVRIRGKVEPVFVPRIEEVAAALRDLVHAGDVVAMMGAGNISSVAHGLVATLGGLLQQGRRT
jgi:UDP-N-acetylmuramate--alanine ligase